jgi:regulator of sirC expression with transglutaminase-like and TPR domain
MDIIADAIRPQLELMQRDNLVARIEFISYILFQEMGFGGNVNDYYSHKNSLLSFVLKVCRRRESQESRIDK